MKVLVRINNVNQLGHFQLKAKFIEVRKWLDDNIGEEGKQWEWLRGDLHAQGVYLPTEDDAIVFKLRFGL